MIIKTNQLLLSMYYDKFAEYELFCIAIDDRVLTK